MRRCRTGRAPGRRGSTITASAAALCVGATLLSGCAGGGSEGRLPLDAAAPASRVPPTGRVELSPLDGAPARGSAEPVGPSARGVDSDRRSAAPPSGRDAASSAEPSADATAAPAPATSAPGGPGPSAPGRPRTDAPRPPGPPSPPSSPSSPVPSPTPSRPHPRPTTPPPSPRPAALSLGDPERAPAADRWCEKVTLTLHNTGGSPVRAGTLTFATHIVDLLGTDWSTVESTADLPTPIAPGERRKPTWEVCVDAWRVPLGMHVETREVTADWR
ncbi:hypothetical protein [Streptomyces sp. SAJ15]|uniref:hypothetical protein n=1 Tax=Streptomyces sp. SAJ15 TaxID=2011095 RepID=UPI00118609E7|nr:hypothetical protein [Streptomyces sp. SAJ15]TVL92259.1 hypothetical protein CD790_11100 [Streptomyces sp. SAJ15]